MGFPRILSKNNKIYTKLGEFCLSSDGLGFWIVCHTCQEELQTQDCFWKHIQDEHNFMQHGGGLKQDSRSASMAYMDAEMPLPLYRKLNEDEQRMVAEVHAQQVAAAAAAVAEDEENNVQEEDEEEEMHSKHHEPIDYKDMRAIETATNTNTTSSDGGGGGGGGNAHSGTVDVDIKMEASSLSQTSNTAQVDIPIASTIYQLTPQAGYASIMHHPSSAAALSMLSTAMPMTTSHLLNTTTTSASAPQQQQHQLIVKQEMAKDSNSTTASASVSSDDGERWYVCDHETCGLKFKYQSRLELHRSVHSKERRFACELCGASFKQSCNLSTHRKKKHFLKGSKTLMPPQQETQHMSTQLQQQVVQQQLNQQAPAQLQTLPPQRF